MVPFNLAVSIFIDSVNECIPVPHILHCVTQDCLCVRIFQLCGPEVLWEKPPSTVSMHAAWSGSRGKFHMSISVKIAKTLRTFAWQLKFYWIKDMQSCLLLCSLVEIFGFGFAGPYSNRRQTCGGIEATAPDLGFSDGSYNEAVFPQSHWRERLCKGFLWDSVMTFCRNKLSIWQVVRSY